MSISDKMRNPLFGGLPLASVRNRPGYHWFVVGTVCIGAMMAALDASVINIALPVLKQKFHVPMQVIEWVSLVYLLTLAGLIVPFGRLADIVGRRWMYALGFTVFIIGSAFCGLAGNLTVLLVARVIQAVGAAMLQANSVSIITAATPARSRGKAIGIQASAQGIGLSLGPAVGGALIDVLNWRWIFLVNVPVGIVGTILGILLLPADKRPAKRERFDYVGALFLTPTLVALVFFLNAGLKEGWASSPVVMSYIVFVIGLCVFLAVERRLTWPMVDLKLFRSSIFSLGNLAGILSFTVMYAVLLLVPFYLDNVRGMRPLTAGLYLTVIPIGMTLFTPIAGAAADKFGTRVPMVIGMISAMLGCAALSLVGQHGGLAPLIVGLFFVGMGVGIFTPPNNSRVMGSVPSTRLGIAGGILNMSRTLGMGLGITLGGLAYQGYLMFLGARNELAASPIQMVSAFRFAFLVLAVISLAAVVISFARGKVAEMD